MKNRNPFEVAHPARGAGFVGRATEVEAVERALTFPGARLLVYGDRLSGKSSVLAEAQARLRTEKLPAVVVSFSAATNVTDLSTRVLQASCEQLRKLWKDVGPGFTGRLGPLATLAPHPVTGRPVATLDRTLRGAPVEAQRETLGAVLDALDWMAGKRGKTFGIAIDDLEAIQKFGGPDAEWHLRGVIGRHRNTGYVCTAGDEGSVLKMVESDRAFHGVFQTLELDPLSAEEFGDWIDSRFKRSGVKSKRGLGREIIDLVGPRTGDIVRLASRVYWMASDGGKARGRDLPLAVESVVDDLQELLAEQWSHLTARQQNLLRALAAGELQPFAERVRRLYDLRSSAAVARTLELMIQKGLVVKSDAGYALVSPYRRRWVERTALPDLGGVPE